MNVRHTFAIFLLMLLAFASSLFIGSPHVGQAQGNNLALRFYGHGVNDIDRVKIRLDAPARPIDVGADFTFEFWMKATLSDNPGVASCNQNDGWITANIMFDRDIWGTGDYGDFGIALSNGRIAFGVNNGSAGTTLCGATNVADGVWHHIALTRNSANGQLRIFVDGTLDGQVTSVLGNLSYRDGRTTSYPNSDPFLVIGAEKHDAGSQYPSYNGLIDEVRVSNILRYTGNFTRPSAPFTTDANTVALYRFNEGPAGACTGTILDSSGASGGPSNGECKYGGSAPAGPVYTTDTPFSGASPTNTFTPTRTATYTPTYTPTATNTPTFTPTNTPTSTPTNTPTGTLSNTPTSTSTNTPTATSTLTNTPTHIPTATNTPTFTPTNTPTPTPTATSGPPPPPSNPIYLPLIFTSAALLFIIGSLALLGTAWLFFRRAVQ